MRDPFFRPLTSLSSSQDSLFHRIRDNFRQLFAPVRIFPSSANGAPLHLPRWGGIARPSRAHSASLVTHAAIIVALLLAAVHPPTSLPKRPTSGDGIKSLLPPPKDLLDRLRGHNPSDGTGSGGGRTPIPATS